MLFESKELAERADTTVLSLENFLDGQAADLV